MSKGMLGMLPLSAVRGPRDTLDELLAGSEGERVLDELKKFNRREPCWIEKAVPVEMPKIEIKPIVVVELGEFDVNYDETIADKLTVITDPKKIGWVNKDWATDEKFPDARTGKKRFKASAVSFGRAMLEENVGRWCKDNKKVHATPKEGIDIARVSSRPKLDNVMPLALAGQFFVDARDRRHTLYFYCDSAERRLSSVWLGPDKGQWPGNWWFLVLEELPPVV